MENRLVVAKGSVASEAGRKAGMAIKGPQENPGAMEMCILTM